MWMTFVVALIIATTMIIITNDWWTGVITVVISVVFTLTLRAGIVVVPARKAAIIFNRLKIYSGLRNAGPGFIIPFWEYVVGFLDLGLKTVQLTLGDIHTRDQIPVTLSVSLIYRLDPWHIQPEMRSQIIDLLELSAPGILQRHVGHLLRRLVGQQEISSLFQPEVRAYLEDCLTQELPRQIARLGVAISGQVMLTSIKLPETIQDEINLAQQTHIHAKARSDALCILREILGTHPDWTWEKVIEAEIIEAITRNGVPVMLPYSMEGGMGSFRNQANGKS